MKSKHLILLGVLLSQTTSIWANPDEDRANTPQRVAPTSQGVQKDQEEITSAQVERLDKRMKEARKTIQKRLADKDNPNKVIVIGRSGTGKTTLIQGFAGQLKAVRKGRKLQLQAENPLPDFAIATTEASSTKIPAGWEDDKSHNRVFWDCPGFDDTGTDEDSGPEDDIMNAMVIKEVFTKETNAKILLAMPDWFFEDTKKGEFQKLLNKVSRMFPDNTQLQKSLSIVVTQTGAGDVREDIKGLNLKNLKLLTPKAKSLLQSIIDNIETRVTSFPAPTAPGDYTFDKDSIYQSLESLQHTSNISVQPEIGAEAKILVDQFARKLNSDISTYLKTNGAQRINDYSNNEIDSHDGTVTALRTKLKSVQDAIKSLSTITEANVEVFATTLSPYITDPQDNSNALSDMIANLKFLKGIRDEVTYSLDTWRASLEDTKKSLKALLTTQIEVKKGILYVKSVAPGYSDVQTALSNPKLPSFKEIRVFGSRRILADSDITWAGGSISFSVSDLDFAQKVTVNLKGANGGNGATSGAPGQHGQNGGHLYINAHKRGHFDRLKVQTDGGNGGNGVDGGDGANGADGVHATLSTPSGNEPYNWNFTQGRLTEWVGNDIAPHEFSLSGTRIFYRTKGTDATAGKDGDQGGQKGLGGHKGSVRIKGVQYNHVAKDGTNGTDGNGGQGGTGGTHGQHSEGVLLTGVKASYETWHRTGIFGWGGCEVKSHNPSVSDRWEVASAHAGSRGKATNGTKPTTLNATGQKAKVAQTQLNYQAIDNEFKTYLQQQAADPLVASFVNTFSGL